MADRWDQHYETIDIALRPYGAVGVTVNSAGNTPVYQPAGGRGMFLQYLCLSADALNAGPVLVRVFWEDAVSDLYRLSLLPGAIWARNIGAGRRALRGGVDKRLFVNLSAAEAVHVSWESEDH